MTQFLQPDSNLASSNWDTGGYAEIDDGLSPGSDYARSNSLDYSFSAQTAYLLLGLSDPPSIPGPGLCTLRYEIAKFSLSSPSSTGVTITVTASIYQGDTLVASDVARTAGGAFASYSFTFDAGLISNWNDVRIHFFASSASPSGSSRRAAISWAYLEVPDPLARSNMIMAFA